MPKLEDGDMTEEYRMATEMLLYFILKAPNVKIYEEQKIIHLTKGVQQGGCASPILYIAYANKFARIIKETSRRRGLSIDDYLVMNWADDVNYMFTNIEDAYRTITALKEIAADLNLPFSKKKCKLVPLYPCKYPYKLRAKMGAEIENLVTISKEAKILGVTWSQPRYRFGQPQMFRKDADEALAKIREVQQKMRRLKSFGCYISRTTQNIIVNTYLFSKVRYGMVVMWDLIPVTRRKKMNSMLRSCTKRIRSFTQQSDVKYFEAVSGYEPMGLKVIQRMLKIQQKLQLYYPHEKENFNEKWESENYWENFINLCCPGMENLINIEETGLMRKENTYKKRKISLLYQKDKLAELDPKQSRKLANVPLVVKDKKDWNKYNNTLKLIINNYWQMRNKSNCTSCKEAAVKKKMRKDESSQ